MKRLTSVKLEAKVKSSALLLGTTGELRVAVSLANNTVELHSMRIHDSNEGRELFYSLPDAASSDTRFKSCLYLMLF